MITKEQLLNISQGKIDNLNEVHEELALLPEHQRQCYLAFIIDNIDDNMKEEVKTFLRSFSADLRTISDNSSMKDGEKDIYDDIDQFFTVE